MTTPLTDEALADLLAKAEIQESIDEGLCSLSGRRSRSLIAVDGATVASLVREVQEARAASRCGACKRPLNGWSEPACSGCDKEPMRCRCDRLP